jgi:hypothetical protein
LYLYVRISEYLLTAASKFGGTVMHLLVGPRNRKFSAHEDVLYFRSTYVKEHFQQVCKELPASVS